MELSEAVSVPNHSEDLNFGAQSSQFHTLGLDPALHVVDHAAELDRVHAKLQKLDLKDKEEGPGKDSDEGWEWKVEKNSSDGADGNAVEKSDVSDRDSDIKIENGDNNEETDGDDADGGEEQKRGEKMGSNSQYPLRPEAEDCAYYLKTGTCKFGSCCKFNHPVRKKTQASIERLRHTEDSVGQPSKTECKYYLKTGGCKFGEACRYNHTKARAFVASVLELNFLGLPIRPDERECHYYMRTGSCKYGANCRFNHPDPTTVAASDSPSGYNNGLPVRAASQPQITSWTSPRALSETTTFVPAMISPSQGVPSQDPEWSAYQAPIYPSEISVLPTPTYVVNNIAPDTDLYAPHRHVDEYPERPGQPECSYFLKTGDCKFKSLCKYHHPKNRNAKLTSCNLNDKGLPLRPDQNICTYYSRYGICKFGPSCKFDHPVLPTSTVNELERQPPYGNLTAGEGAEIAGGGSGNNSSIKQSA